MALQVRQLRKRFVADRAGIVVEKIAENLKSLWKFRRSPLRRQIQTREAVGIVFQVTQSIARLTTQKAVHLNAPWCASTRCSGSENVFHKARTCICFRSGASPDGRPSPRWCRSAVEERKFVMKELRFCSVWRLSNKKKSEHVHNVNRKKEEKKLEHKLKAEKEQQILKVTVVDKCRIMCRVVAGILEKELWWLSRTERRLF